MSKENLIENIDKLSRADLTELVISCKNKPNLLSEIMAEISKRKKGLEKEFEELDKLYSKVYRIREATNNLNEEVRGLKVDE